LSSTEQGSAQLHCYEFDFAPLNPDSVTLQWLIDTRRRLIVKSGGRNFQDTWSDGYAGVGNNELLETIRTKIFTQEPKTGRMDRIWTVKLFRGLGVDPGTLNLNLGCSKGIARDTSKLYPGEEANTKYPLNPEPECAGTCGCMRYRSEIEVIQQEMLNRNEYIIAVIVDYASFGDVVHTTRRMNFANYRRLAGEKELGTPWYNCGWAIALFVCAGLLLLILTWIYCVKYLDCLACFATGRRRRRNNLGFLLFNLALLHLMLQMASIRCNRELWMPIQIRPRICGTWTTKHHFQQTGSHRRNRPA